MKRPHSWESLTVGSKVHVEAGLIDRMMVGQFVEGEVTEVQEEPSAVRVELDVRRMDGSIGRGYVYVRRLEHLRVRYP